VGHIGLRVLDPHASMVCKLMALAYTELVCPPMDVWLLLSQLNLTRPEGVFCVASLAYLACFTQSWPAAYVAAAVWICWHTALVCQRPP
jgi:hypothetical protein